MHKTIEELHHQTNLDKENCYKYLWSLEYSIVIMLNLSFAVMQQIQLLLS